MSEILSKRDEDIDSDDEEEQRKAEVLKHSEDSRFKVGFII
jgi:hypothetical protein